MTAGRILIVDDNPQNAKLARVLLVSEGYEVRTAGDAQEALAILDSFEAGVILMDIQMPGMDGLQLTSILKADPRRAQVAIIALTAYAMKGDRERALAAGCDDYIAKPIDADALMALVARYVSAHSGA